MKNIYSLEMALKADTARVEAAQKLTRDDTRPLMGFKGVYGLFGSAQWWSALKDGTIPTRKYLGIIETIQFEGMHNEGRSFTIGQERGEPYNYSCVVNQRDDMRFYNIGNRLRITAFIEPKKDGTDLEMVWTIEAETLAANTEQR